MLHRRVSAFREHLLRDFRRQAEKEIVLSARKIQEIIESPLQNVRAERSVLAAKREELGKADSAADLRTDAAATEVEPEKP